MDLFSVATLEIMTDYQCYSPLCRSDKPCSSPPGLKREKDNEEEIGVFNEGT